ncbi:MAG: ABC transporter permease, partial [Achromobacter sp.]
MANANTPRISSHYRSTLTRLFTTTAIAAGIAAALAAPAPAHAQPAAVSDDIVRLGLILDMSGVYADVTGKG